MGRRPRVLVQVERYIRQCPKRRKVYRGKAPEGWAARTPAERCKYLIGGGLGRAMTPRTYVEAHVRKGRKR